MCLHHQSDSKSVSNLSLTTSYQKIAKKMKKERTHNDSSLMGQRVSMYIDGLFNQPSQLQYYYIKFRTKRRQEIKTMVSLETQLRQYVCLMLCKFHFLHSIWFILLHKCTNTLCKGTRHLYPNI